MRTLILFLVCFSTALFSCQKDEVSLSGDTGSLSVNLGLSLQINDVSSNFKSLPSTESFKVTVYRTDGSIAVEFDSASIMPDTIELDIGNYYVEAHSNNDLPAAFENPYYFGASEVFTISSNTTESVLVSCGLANTMVSVAWSDNVGNLFTDYTATVSSDMDSLVYSKDEIRVGYFQPLPLDVLVELTYLLPGGSDTSKFLSGQIPDPLPNRHYEILVDASIDAGMAAFQILLDSSEVLVEVVELSEQQIIPIAGSIGFGELLITEVMYNPSALSDTEGEWFEIYNNSGRTINLKNLILGRDDSYRHTITDSIDLPAGEYLVLERSATATDAALFYVYNSGILLPNTGALLSIFNEGTETDPGALIFAVDYGLAGFPDGTGASICLDPVMLTAADAVNGSSWCLSTSTYITGDLGTPGLTNDPCQ